MSPRRAQTQSGLPSEPSYAPRYSQGCRFVPDTDLPRRAENAAATRAEFSVQGTRFLDSFDQGARIPAEDAVSGTTAVSELPARAEVTQLVRPARAMASLQTGGPARVLLADTPVSDTGTGVVTRIAGPARALQASAAQPEMTGSSWTPARALVPVTTPASAGSLRSPRARRRFCFAPKTFLSTLAAVAVAGSVAYFGVSAGAAAPGGQVIPASAIQSIFQPSPTSRELSRPESSTVKPTSTTTSPVQAAGSASAGPVGSASGSAASSTSSSETASATASSPASPTTPAPPATVDGTTAPGQKAASSVTDALARAKSMTGNMDYADMCLALVASFYGYSTSGEVGAQQAAEQAASAGQLHTDMSNIPLGALIWYSGDSVGNPYGHVAMYAGNGMVYSNGAGPGSQVGLISIDTPVNSWHEPFIGWSGVWLPHATD